MGAWESFAAGWRVFWSCKGVVAVGAINFAINFVVSLILGIFMVIMVIAAYISGPKPGLSPHYRTLSYVLPSTPWPFPGFGPSHHPPGTFGPTPGWPSSLPPGLIIAAILFFLVFMAMSAFVAAATPGSLLAAIKNEFNVPAYFRQARTYFWRAFGFLWFNVAVLSLLFLLLGLIGAIAYTIARWPGIIVAGLVIIAGWIYVTGVLLITMIKYLTSKEEGLFAYIAQSAGVVLKRYWSWLTLALMILIFSLLVTAFSFIFFIIPLIGPLFMSFIVFCLLNVAYVAVMSFAGLVGGRT